MAEIKKTTEFDLMTNAEDSLRHAVMHLTDSKKGSPNQWKIAVREVAHVIELLLKERLKRAHPAFIWVDVDKYPLDTARTVTSEQAASRLANISKIILPKEFVDTLKACRGLRNRIEHYEFKLHGNEARGIVGRMLSFIFQFASKYLEWDLEGQFKKDAAWKTLVEIHEFWETHGTAVEEEINSDKLMALECPVCGGNTFVLDEDVCRLCGHEDQQAKCDVCHEYVWASDLEGVAVDEHADISICSSCRSQAEHDAYDYYDYDPS